MAIMLDNQMEGLINSWAIRWCYEQFKRNMYTIYPVKSLITNGGLDGSGTHKEETQDFCVEVSNEKRKLVKNIQLDLRISRNFKKKYKLSWKGKIKQTLNLLGLEGVVKICKKKR